VLAVGLGLFALTFDASLQRNAADRAAYTAGADVRALERTAGGAAYADEEQRMAALPGVLQVMAGYRSLALSNATHASSQAQVDVLAIDPATFTQVSTPGAWRSDYADQPLGTLLARMRANVRGEAAGTPDAPLWVLISPNLAALLHLKVGDHFTLAPSEDIFATPSFVVGAIVSEFPTLYPNDVPGGFLVADASDYMNALWARGMFDKPSPNEFWLRTSADPAKHAQLLNELTTAHFPNLTDVVSLPEVRETTSANPISAGMRGLLLVGALTAAILAVLGCIAQSALASRQRAEQFAVLRTLGMPSRQITGLLLGEQLVVYAFGLAGGTILGLLLVTATLPFLQFSDSAVNVGELGVPPYLLVFNLPDVALFYAALVAAFALALAIGGRFASRLGLGSTLRLGED
jgi:hypothetical protein